MKKILALCLTVMLVLAMVPVIGAAAADVVTLSVGKATALPGETVEIAVSIAGNETTGLSSAKFNIGYNSDVFEIVTYVDEDGNEWEAQDLGHGGIEAQFGPATNNPFVVNWAHGTKKTTKAGDVAIVRFKVKENAPVGKYALELTVNPADVFVVVKPDTVAVDFTTVSGEIEVISCRHDGGKTTTAAKASTCTEQGNAQYVTCDLCGTVIEGSDDKLPLADHSYVEKVDAKYLVSAATCTAKAVYNKSCSACGVANDETFTAGELAAHVYDQEVVEDKYLAAEATCITKAAYYKSCVCGAASTEATFDNGDVNADNHTGETYVDGYKAHTETDDGYTGDEKCAGCDVVINAGEVIAAGHIAVEVPAKDATCDEAGNTAHWECELCENIFAAETVTDEDIIEADSVVVEALGHDYGDWKVTKEATATEKGSKEKVCATCGDKVVEEIPALGTPATDDKVDNNKTDSSTTAPATGDVANIFVVVSMLMAIAAAAVVVLKKKA